MKLSRLGLILALVASLAGSVAARADVNYGVTPSNGKPAPGPLGYTWNGSAWLPLPSDTDGNLYVRSITPNMVVISHKTNVTVASAGVDTSAVPFQTSQYRQLYAFLRVKAGSFASGAALEIAAKGCFTAQTDSTALGWWFAMGGGASQKGRVAMLTTLADRWKMIPLADSISGQIYQAPYTELAITNRTGAQIIYDLWLLGVPW